MAIYTLMSKHEMASSLMNGSVFIGYLLVNVIECHNCKIALRSTNVCQLYTRYSMKIHAKKQVNYCYPFKLRKW